MLPGTFSFFSSFFSSGSAGEDANEAEEWEDGCGEEVEDDKSIPKNKKFGTKTFGQKFMTVIAGIMNNFILAILLFFIIALISGAPQNKAIVGEISEDYPAYTSGLKTGDRILKINGKNAKTYDTLALELQVNNGKKIEMEVDRNGKTKTINLTPKKEKQDGQTVYKYGFTITDEVETGLFASLKYAFTKTFSLLHQMILIIAYLVTGNLNLTALSGPVGIYSIVGTAASSGILSILSLTALLSVNVGFINLLPLPAFDGGRLLFIIIEKIKGKPVDPRLENTIHSIGFFLLMALMLLITYNDIIRLIK